MAISTPIRASERDLRALAAIVSKDRPDLPDGEGLPPSLLADLMSQIRCDGISLESFDSERRVSRFLQGIPGLGDDGLEAYEDLNQATWPLYWGCQPCSYPERTGDLRSIIKISDFYSTRQWHANGMYSEIYRPEGLEHELQLCLPDPAAGPPGPAGRSGCSSSASPGRTSPSVTGPCSRCYVRT